MMFGNDQNITSVAPAPISNSPYVVITEQPAERPVKFRYKSEPSRGGLIFGTKSTPENKASFPKIRVIGYTGPAAVVVSCVTKDQPFRTHPHNLVGKNCKEGICEMRINCSDGMSSEFPNLGVQCVKRNDVEEELKRLEEKRIDPYRWGFDHRSNLNSINLNVVRLCFQVFLPTGPRQKFTHRLEPVVSEPIYDKKAMSELVITRLSHSSAHARGGDEMILLCEKVIRDDIEIRFFDDRLGWEGFGRFEPADVHKQYAIFFRTPAYRDITITQKEKVYIQLRRKSDGKESEPLPFFFKPNEPGKNKVRRSPYPINIPKSQDIQDHLIHSNTLPNRQPTPPRRKVPRPTPILTSSTDGSSYCCPGSSFITAPNPSVPNHPEINNHPIQEYQMHSEQKNRLPSFGTINPSGTATVEDFNCLTSSKIPDLIVATDSNRRTSQPQNYILLDRDFSSYTDSPLLQGATSFNPGAYFEQLFSVHHPPFMDYNASVESSYPNNANVVSLEDTVDSEDLIYNNNDNNNDMESLSENLSSISMSS